VNKFPSLRPFLRAAGEALAWLGRAALVLLIAFLGALALIHILVGLGRQ
jgi:hypothetical protein